MLRLLGIVLGDIIFAIGVKQVRLPSHWRNLQRGLWISLCDQGVKGRGGRYVVIWYTRVTKGGSLSEID